MGVGSGIVIDSNPGDEFRECLLKAEFLTRPANQAAHPSPHSFSLVESLLWQRGYPLIEMHLDRLEDSATYFAFPFNRTQTKAALQTTDSKDLMYFHKTTHRPLYTEVLKAAIAAGYNDVLFLNQRGEVTEGAIHNIFIEMDGHLLTPPVDGGLLPGVHRRHILANHPNAEERVLSLDDLREADAIYLSNAVRGLRRAVIHWDSAC